MRTKGPQPADIQVGVRIRVRRLQRSMSQTDLAERLGLTFQQVQKYEKGANRVGAGRLQQIARILGVPVSFFFAGEDDGTAHRTDPSAFEFLSTARAMRLAKAYARVKDAHLQRAIVNLVEHIADGR